MLNRTAKGDRLKRKVKKELIEDGYMVHVPPKTKWQKDIFGFDLLAIREDDLVFIESTVKEHKSDHLKRLKDNQFYQRFRNIYKFEMYLWDSKKKKFLIEKI